MLMITIITMTMTMMAMTMMLRLRAVLQFVIRRLQWRRLIPPSMSTPTTSSWDDEEDPRDVADCELLEDVHHLDQGSGWQSSAVSDDDAEEENCSLWSVADCSGDGGLSVSLLLLLHCLLHNSFKGSAGVTVPLIREGVSWIVTKEEDYNIDDALVCVCVCMCCSL